MNKDDIRKYIFSLQDKKYREFHASLVPGEDNIIGVRVPVLRKYAKELYNKHTVNAAELIRVVGNDYYEEIMLQGMIIGLQKKLKYMSYLSK